MSSKTFLFPPIGPCDMVVLSDHEKNFHLDQIKVMRSQELLAQAMKEQGEISGSALKKVRAEVHNIEQNYIKSRGLFFHRYLEKLVQDKDRYVEEKFPEEHSPEAEAEGGRTGSGPSEHSRSEDREREGVLESGSSEEGRT